MSDPETGDSEGGENPDPEDDAQLSAHPHGTAASEHAESVQPPPSQAQAPGDTGRSENGHATVGSDAQAGDGGSSLSQQTGTGALSASEENRADGVETQAAGAGDGTDSELGEGEKTEQQEWTPESDRCGGGCGDGVPGDARRDSGGQAEEDAEGACQQVGAGSASDNAAVLSEQETDNAAGPEALQEPVKRVSTEGSAADNCDQQPGNLVLSEGGATDNSDREPVNRVLSEGSATGSSDREPVNRVLTESSAAEHSDREPVNHASAEGNATDNSDQEESPPEDELFAMSTPPVCAEGGAAVDGGKTGVDAGGGYADLDHNTNSMDTGSADAPPHSTSQDAPPTSASGGSPAETKTCVENGSGQSALHPPDFQCVGVLMSKTAEKEDDQIPECDREQSPHSSPLCSGGGGGVGGGGGDQAAPSDSDAAAVSARANSPQSRLSAQSRDAGAAPSSSSSNPDAVAPGAADRVSPPHGGEGFCDNSGECDTDSTAAVRGSSTSSRPPPTTNGGASARLAGASGGRDLLLMPSFDQDDSEDEDLLTELDAELHLPCSPGRREADLQGLPVRLPLNGLKELDPMNSELCKQFEDQLLQFQETVLQREREIHR